MVCGARVDEVGESPEWESDFRVKVPGEEGTGVSNGEAGSRHAPLPEEALPEQREEPSHELPETIKALIDARTGDAVYVVGPDYTIIHWDRNMESLSGVLSEEALGRRCYEAVMGEAEGGRPFCAHGCSVMHLARHRRPFSSFELRIKTRTGRRWVNVSNLSVETEEGPYLVHLLRDSQGTHDALEMARGLIRLSSKGEAPAPARKNAPVLTERQLEVLKLLSEGKSAREIGRELYLSQSTVRNHIRALLQALGAHSQLEGLARARQMGII